MLTDLQKAKIQELQEAYLIARYRGRKQETEFWNKELTDLLIGVLNDSGDTETTSGTDTGKP
jgi:hypothetical protein